MSQQYGATPEEWITFDLLLGLTEDLLPVVSNPDATISKRSKVKQAGKVPSVYNDSHKLVGFPDWTNYRTNGRDVSTWLKERDYGICLQTRYVRALDVDVPDIHKSNAIYRFIAEFLQEKLRCRFREDSGKFLCAFRLPGEYAKRTVRVDGGMIEFLANGQQFIAVGTHPDGARYRWDGELEFALLSAEAFEALWSALILAFGVEGSTVGNIRQRGQTVLLHDEVVEKLDVLSWGPQGQAHIECPFKEHHTTDSGESSTSYFPRGTNGYEQGHFVCLHAHCADRGDEEFLDAFGIRAAQFQAVVQAPSTELEKPWPRLKRAESGEVYPTLDNLYQVLQRSDVCLNRIAYDRFKDEVVMAPPGEDNQQWRSLSDNDYTIVQRQLESRISFKPIAVDLLRRAVLAVAYENSFDSAILWINNLEWDGVPRIDGFMAQYMNSENTAYARAVSRYLWTALAGRTLVPGIKADMMPIFVSGQGTYKSSTIEALAPSPEYFCKINFNDSDDNLTRKMRGRLVAEVAELRGFLTKDNETIKDFVSATHEMWVPKWKEHTSTFARRLVFIATTNQREIFNDETGNRRWLPIEVGTTAIEDVRRDRDQLWAEARELFMKVGICFKEAERLATNVHENYSVIDPWEQVIEEWLRTAQDLGGARPLQKGYLTMPEIMQDALRIEAKNMKGIDGKRIAKILRGRKFERTKKWMGEKSDWVWRPIELL